MVKYRNLPENKYAADAVVLNDKVYIIAGSILEDQIFQQSLRRRPERLRGRRLRPIPQGWRCLLLAHLSYSRNMLMDR